eukprot:TRINITY_DN42325_c0_g1_i1.p1 TRINITY_DN42325_c0_g1~~TRINITY_DN42325_c0_g1_i1.p1  ORF type:complete len:411 (-),score=87.63 TRINITY_DN42325_c0_g1_i1:22-1254(-)
MASVPESLDVLLPSFLEFVAAPDALQASAVSRSWRDPGRSDQVWMRACRSRWRFGAMLGASSAAPPGARDEASLEHWLQSVENQRAGSGPSVEAFRFYGQRCKCDEEVQSLLQRLANETVPDEAEVAKLKDLDADALDVLLKLERGERSRLQALAAGVRVHISNRWAANKWAQLMGEPKQAATLEEGALVLSQWARPDADVPSMRGTLEQLADRSRELGGRISSTGDELPGPEEAKAVIEALNTTLFKEFGLRGNSGDYYNADNSLLHAVLKTKKGIPISLSVVWAAVARRCGLSCHPLAGFPGHVLIRVPLRPPAEVTAPSHENDLYIDAFDGGSIMAFRELQTFLGRRLGGLVPREQLAEFVGIHPPVAIYLRMMRNLENIYRQSQDVRLQGIADQMIVLSGRSGTGY